MQAVSSPEVEPRVPWWRRWLRLAVLALGLLVGPAGSAATEEAPVQRLYGTEPVFGLGSWMWDRVTAPQQECGFWRTFEIPAGAQVARARLRIAADNFYRIHLNGRRIAQGSDWRILTEYDLTLVLGPGTHVLAIQAVNDFDKAGVLLGLRIELADGRLVELGSGEGWRTIPPSHTRWEARTAPKPDWGHSIVVGKLGQAPWGNPGYTSVMMAPPILPLDIRFWQTGWFQASLATVCGVVILVCLYLGSRLVIQTREQQVVRRERARIARDIHDELTAGLTKLVLLGETTQQDLPKESETRGQITQLCEQTRGLLGSMNETIWVINSQRDTVRDLVSYVSKYAETFLRQTPIRCRFDLDRELPAAACDVATRRNLFLATKEALNNVVRHSGATEVHLRCHWDDDEIVVAVEDNGKGFDPALADPMRNGLTNMQQRAIEVGGSCEIDSRPGIGTCVEFRLPLQRSTWWGFVRGLFGRRAAKKGSPLNPERD